MGHRLRKECIPEHPLYIYLDKNYMNYINYNNRGVGGDQNYFQILHEDLSPYAALVFIYYISHYQRGCFSSLK